jgi:hypothetical protein
MVCPASFHCSLWEVSVPCHKDVINYSFPSLIPRQLQERMAQRKEQWVQNEGEMPCFSPMFSKLLDPSKVVSGFQQKQFEHLLHDHQFMMLL